MNDFSLLKNIINPYNLYNKIRNEDPVFQLEEDTWMVTRYDDVKNGLMNHELFVSARKQELYCSQLLRKEFRGDSFIATEDPPEYDIHRSIVSEQFQKQNVDKYRKAISEHSLIALKRIKNKKKFNFFDDYAYPFIGSSINAFLGFGTFQSYSESHK